MQKKDTCRISGAYHVIFYNNLIVYLRANWRIEMAKKIKKPKVALSFSCSDSYDRKYEIVMSTNRNWYIRQYVYNGYGMGWSKWEKTAPRKVMFYTENRFFGDMGRVRCYIASIDCGFSGKSIDVLKAGNVKVTQPRYRLPL